MSFDFEFKIDQLDQIIHGNPYVTDWYNALIAILPEYGIDNIPRVAAFLSQCAHESNEFKSLKENLNYRAESLMKTFHKYFPTMEIAEQYAHNQVAIANRVYANRMGNGPEESGDGYRFCGRGLIQITGHDNYQMFADSIQMNISDVPEYLSTFEGAVQSAAWFWECNNLNQYADAGDILTVTRKINGGDNGLADRTDRYNHALQVLQG